MRKAISKTEVVESVLDLGGTEQSTIVGPC
jgi:hypothetical protein